LERGCHDTKGLFEQIQQFGYAGSYDTVARYTRRLRFSQGIPLRERLVKSPYPLSVNHQNEFSPQDALET
jgi:hypothetical protein